MGRLGPSASAGHSHLKQLPYEKQNYEAGLDEAAVKKLTGQMLVPVLIHRGQGDSGFERDFGLA